MQVICLEEDPFFALVEQVVDRLGGGRNAIPDKWIDGEEAMRMLNIKASSTLQSLRDEFLNPARKSFYMTGIQSTTIWKNMHEKLFKPWMTT